MADLNDHWSTPNGCHPDCPACASDVSVHIRAAHHRAECPDCKEDIPKDVVDGQECARCGHVFHLPEDVAKRLEVLKQSVRPQLNNQAVLDALQELVDSLPVISPSAVLWDKIHKLKQLLVGETRKTHSGAELIFKLSGLPDLQCYIMDPNDESDVQYGIASVELYDGCIAITRTKDPV